MMALLQLKYFLSITNKSTILKNCLIDDNLIENYAQTHL